MIRLTNPHTKALIRRYCNEWMQTKFIPSNVTTTQNCNLCFLYQSRSLSCQRHKNIKTPTHPHFNVNNYSRTLCLTLLPHQVQSSHRRQFSAETWKYYSSTDFPPVNVAYESFIAIHEFTGLPWWATVILSTVLLRSILTLPLFVVSQATIARYKNVQTDLKEISFILKMDVFKYSRENNLSHVQSDRLLKQEMKKHYNKKMVEENCHPFRAFLVGFVQVPAWVFVSLGLRNLCGYSYSNKGNDIYEGFDTGGILWFTDLTIADPTFILPVILGCSNLLIIEIIYLSNLSSGITETKRTKFIRNFMRLFSIGLVPLGAMVPSVLCLYWSTSSVYGVVQNLVMQQPRVRRALQIPYAEGESKTPISDMIKSAKLRYLKKS